MHLIIKEAKNTDRPQILELIGYLKQFESQFDEHYKINKQSIIDLYDDIKSKGIIFISEIDNKVVGFISIELNNKNDELIEEIIPVAYISDMVVSPEHRNQGVGKKLLETAETWAKNKNIRYLKLIVFSNNNNAKKIYSDFGFNEYETTMLKDLAGHRL
jgi:ribosomal protein S18 acetylase RimI-like enzyme